MMINLERQPQDLQDGEGYVNMIITHVEQIQGKTAYGILDYRTFYGIIRINQDLTLKRLMVSGYAEIVIENELPSPLAVGDERFFRLYGSSSSLDPENIRIADNWYMLNGAGLMGMNQSLDMGLDFIASQWIPNAMGSSITVYSLNSGPKELKPLHFECEIIRVAALPQNNEIIANYQVPALEGYMPVFPMNFTAFDFRLPAWDLTDSEGNLVPPGQYRIMLKLPPYYEFYLEGSEELLKMPITSNIRWGPSYDFEVNEDHDIIFDRGF
jgi:hypothetical protein